MKTYLIILTFLIGNLSFSQNRNNNSESQTTKIEQFSSQTGVITKFTDTNLSNLKASYVVAKTRIRKLESGGVERYFYQIEKPNKYSNSTASIEYTDLLEIIKALNSLKTAVSSDTAKNPDYLENKFISEDGFQVGYYINKAKVSWYLKLEKYGTDNTLFVKNVDEIELNFIEAKRKIEDLKNNQ